MSELQEKPDADPDALEAATAVNQAPAWVGKTSGAYIVGRQGLLGWGRRVVFGKQRGVEPGPQDAFQPTEPIRTRIYIPVFRLTPEATISLCSIDAKGYRGVFDDSWVYYSCPSEGEVLTKCILRRAHVVWASFKYWETSEPVLHDLLLSSKVAEAHEVGEMLRWARKCKADLGLSGASDGDNEA